MTTETTAVRSAVELAVAATGLTKIYRVRRSRFSRPAELRAVDDVSFALRRGRTLAVWRVRGL